MNYLRQYVAPVFTVALWCISFVYIRNHSFMYLEGNLKWLLFAVLFLVGLYLGLIIFIKLNPELIKGEVDEDL